MSVDGVAPGWVTECLSNFIKCRDSFHLSILLSSLICFVFSQNPEWPLLVEEEGLFIDLYCLRLRVLKFSRKACWQSCSSQLID